MAAGFFGALSQTAQPQPPATEGAKAPESAAALAFLRDLRPIFAAPAAAPAAVPPILAVPGGPSSAQPPAVPEIPPAPLAAPEIANSAAPFDPAAAPAFLQDARPIFAAPPTPAVPSSLGAPESAFPAFSFLEEARPLFSYPPTAPGPVPALQPTDSQPAGIVLSSRDFDVETIRRDFPILRERVNGRPLVWLDNGATTQKPQSVIDRLSYFYAHENSNVHRAAHELAARATDAYESAREKVRRFLNAPSTRDIVFVRGATEGINLVAQSWGRQNIHKDDEIVITWLEHHANIVPWQMLCSEVGARLRVAPVDDSGQVILEEYEKLLGPRTRLVAVTQVSNALGTVTPVSEMVQAAHRHGAAVLVDGAQAVSHMRVDVQALDCDFYVLSGHKMFAPTGIGVVYGKPGILDVTRPWQGGGNMIQDVTFERTIYNAAPARFEAGTGNIADAVGLGAAIDYLDRVGMENVSRREADLLHYGTEGLRRVPGLRIIGTAREKAGVLSFVMEGIRTEEVGDYLNQEGIAVRSGHHCAQPILRRFGLESTVRASLALYNTCEDIDALVSALQRLQAARGHRG
jgi:cysteine desulfurase/selenocysteine lyase